MPGLFQGISTMNTALRAFQRALDVTGHNITNVNTPGYSRQQVQLVESDPTRYQASQPYFLGNGVTLASVSRIQDQFLFARQIQSTAEDGRLGSLSSGLDNVQAIMNEPGGSSIGDALSALFNAWSALGSSPNDTANLTAVQQAGSTLASRVRGMYGSLMSQASSVNGQIVGTIQQAQGLVNQVAALNQQIRSQQQPGATPNDLIDARDQAINQLSQIMPLTVAQQADGSVMMFSGQMTLVDSAGAKTIPTTYNAATSTLSNGTDTFTINSGQLAGLFQTSQRITAYQGQLDTLANTLRTQFNTIHATGINGLGATGQNFFQDVAAGNPQTGAIDFDLDPAVKADIRAIATGVSGDPGDGGLALSMSQLRDSPIAAFGGKTFSGFYGDIVAGVGQDAATAHSLSATSSAVLQQIGQQVQSVSGVSLDDEMSNMLRFQRSYQAAAKALSVFDQTTEDLLNMIQ